MHASHMVCAQAAEKETAAEAADAALEHAEREYIVQLAAVLRTLEGYALVTVVDPYCNDDGSDPNKRGVKISLNTAFLSGSKPRQINVHCSVKYFVGEERYEVEHPPESKPAPDRKLRLTDGVEVIDAPSRSLTVYAT